MKKLIDKLRAIAEQLSKEQKVSMALEITEVANDLAGKAGELLYASAWYVVQDTGSGKYADGFFGWDSNIHSDEQIFQEDKLPYHPNDAMAFIEVACGNKPCVTDVQDFMGRHNAMDL